MATSGSTILLDLDGTLTDPREGIVGCLKHTLGTVGITPPEDKQLEACIGPPLHESLALLLGASHSARLADAIATYRARYSAKGLFENHVYPGIPEVLEQLRESGASLIVATSKPQRFAERILEHFELRKFFRAVHGSELDGTRSQKTGLLAYILDSEALPASASVMIGDRAHDVVGAKANGVRSIGALWGYGSREELLSAGADALCDQPGNLVETLSKCP